MDKWQEDCLKCYFKLRQTKKSAVETFGHCSGYCTYPAKLEYETKKDAKTGLHKVIRCKKFRETE